MDAEEEEDVEDGEVNNGFLGEAEMENRKTLAAAYGDEISWVEAVLLGAKHLAPASNAAASEHGDGGGEGGDEEENEALFSGEPPPPGTAVDRPPPPAAATTRLEAALVHKVTALLAGGGDNKNGRNDPAETLVETLAEAEADGVDVARWLGHGRSSIRGRTPLMEAARQDQTGCCSVLAEAACAQGAGLNAGNETQGRNSALHYACHEGSGGSVCELLVRGADPRLRNRDGKTALQAALANGQAECADLVRDFLRRPTFEPDPQSGDLFTTPTAAGVAPPADPALLRRHGKSGSPLEAEKFGTAGGGGGSAKIVGGDRTTTTSSGGAKRNNTIGGGVAGVAPEVRRANAVFCLGRRRRRLCRGFGVRPGRGLGVGVGTAAAEIGLGARRGARLHATNPCPGTAMEAFVLWSIADGQDPFRSEAGGEEAAEDEFGEARGKGEDRGAADVWLEHYASVWHDHQQRQGGRSTQASARRGAENSRIRPNKTGGPPHLGETAAAAAAAAVDTAIAGGGGGGSTYALVVKESKALAEGRRFELRCGDNLVIGRSQHLADIVVKDEMVSKCHLRIANSEHAGVRMSDPGSKHGAVITKPAPSSTTYGNAATAAAHPPRKEGGGGEGGGGGGEKGAPAPRPAGLGGPPPPLPKKKFFPIPVPREPEWVAGAHGDRISLGKTVLVLEREGGPEPPASRRRRAAGAGAGAGAGAADGSSVEGGGAGAAGARGKPAPAVISKGFTANPNLMDAIRTAEETERDRKRSVAASQLAAAAAAQYLSNKRARSTATAPPASSAARLATSPAAAAAAAAAAAVAVNVPGAMATGGDDEEDRQQEGGSFEHVSKGSMLLRRMGWKEGQGLGRRSDGPLRPVQVERRSERAGLGTRNSSSPFAVGADGRISKWEQMRRRFSEAAQSSGSGFGEAGRRASGAGGGGRWLKGGEEGGGGGGP